MTQIQPISAAAIDLEKAINNYADNAPTMIKAWSKMLAAIRVPLHRISYDEF